MNDISNYKYRLSDYLAYKNIEQKKGFYRCPNPNHSDENISNCKLYDNADGQVLTCFVCGDNWDVFDTAGLIIGSDDFKEQLSEVERTLGVINVNTSEQVQTKPKPEPLPAVSIPIEKLNEVYNDDFIRQYADKNGYGSTTGKYICYDSTGENVRGVEYRFESDNKKTVFLVWYNGKSIKWTNPPRLIFGLNEIKFANIDGSQRPFLIVEGPKTREIAAEHLPDFNVLTWNGGANNVDKVPWNDIIPEDAEVYLYPDDDQPGVQAMNKLKEILSI